MKLIAFTEKVNIEQIPIKAGEISYLNKEEQEIKSSY